MASASPSISYGLDALGNTSSKTTNGSTVTVSRVFNAQNQESSSSSGQAPVFDNNGNEVKNEGQGMVSTYDAWNRLASVTSSSGTALAVYNYDALGRRILESYPSIAYSTGALNVYSYYSAAGQVLEDRWYPTSNPTSPGAIFQYVWSEAYVNALVLRDQEDGNGVLSQRLYAQQDANWNTTAITDATGAVVSRFEYDPYGVVTVLTPAGVSTGGVNSTNWRNLFQGGRFDLATGSYRFGFRDYSPTEGRWVERDPIGFAADNNFYGLEFGSSTNYVDPSGLAGEHWFNDGPWDWVNPLAYVAAYGYSQGDRLGTGWSSLTNSGFDKTLDLGAARQQRAVAELASPDSSLSASDFAADRNRIMVGGLTEALQHGRNVVDGAVAAAELGYDVASLGGAGMSRGPTVATMSGGRKWRWGFGQIGDDAAEAAYQAIRESTTDVAAISRYARLKPGRIERIKTYLFNNPEWTGADGAIAGAWHRLRTGRGTPTDRLLLKHETAEMWYRKNVADSYRAAHQQANKKWNWERAIQN